MTFCHVILSPFPPPHNNSPDSLSPMRRSQTAGVPLHCSAVGDRRRRAGTARRLSGVCGVLGVAWRGFLPVSEHGRSGVGRLRSEPISAVSASEVGIVVDCVLREDVLLGRCCNAILVVFHASSQVLSRACVFFFARVSVHI